MKTEDIIKNVVQQIKSDNDKRYKKYLEYIEDIDDLEKMSKKFHSKLSIHIIVIYTLQIVMLIKVW